MKNHFISPLRWQKFTIFPKIHNFSQIHNFLKNQFSTTRNFSKNHHFRKFTISHHLFQQNSSKNLFLIGIQSINESKSMPSTPCERNSTGSSSSRQITGLLAKAFKMRTSSSTSAVLNNTNLQWSCTKCTFLNHPALKMCEECEMPRFPDQPSKNSNQDSLSNNCLCHEN